MCRCILLVFSMCLLGLSGGEGRAQPATNSVKFTVGSLVNTGKGGNSISAEGTYTQEAGYTPFGSAILFAVPTGGGQFSQATGAIDTVNKKWGPATVPKLTSGQYTVYAAIVFQDANGKQVTVSSPTTIVTIP